MAFQISFKIENKTQTFKKTDVFLEDNVRAVQYSISEADFFGSDDQTPEKYAELQYKFHQFISDFFGNEFSPEQLAQGFPYSKSDELRDIYQEALGGKAKDDEKK